MVTYGFFDSQNGDRKYNANQMSEYFKGLISDGVYESVGDGMVVEAAEGMTVSIGTGRAIIDCKWLDNSASELVEITMADLVNPRYTAIVVRLDNNRRLMEFDTVDGEAAADPDYPTTTWTDEVKELVLAYVLVGAGATSISQSEITDARSLDVCGWVTGLVDHISIENLYLQWVDLFNAYYTDMQAAFQEWFDDLVGELRVQTTIQNYEESPTRKSGSPAYYQFAPTGYKYEDNDIFFVYINGLKALPWTDYDFIVTDRGTEDEEVRFYMTNDNAENDIYIECLKSRIGFNCLGTPGAVFVNELGQYIRV